MNQPTNLFKALSDGTRLRILALLIAAGELCVCEIIAALKLPQSTISRHLAYLRKHGLVNDRRCGLWMHYSIADRENGFHKALVDFLRQNLAALPDNAADRERLERFEKDSDCV